LKHLILRTGRLSLKNQIQIITTSTSLSTQDIEQYITYPVELEMANLPGVEEIRSVSKFGLSVVTIVFSDDMGTYLPRQLIAEKIKNLTTPSDKIFVAGSESQIYFYSKRLSSSRFNYTYPLIINTSRRLDYQKQAIEDLKTNPPKVIVYCLSPFSGLWNEESPRDFVDFLNKIIAKDYQTYGGYQWGAKGLLEWIENISQNDLETASLLLLVKK